MEAPIRFGSYELDPAAGELRKAGVRVPLSGQPLDVLALLVGRPGEVVAREELKEALWPDDTFVDFDNGLNSAVRRIRRALDDSATDPRFIETLPKRGYRFIGEIEGAASDSSPSSGDPQLRPTRAWIYGVAGAAIAALLVWLAVRPAGSVAPAALPTGQITPLTALPGYEQHPTFSPDGSQVAFSWNGPDREDFDIYLQSLGGGQPRRLTDDPADEAVPAWSPDGRWIAFWRSSGDRGGVYLVPPVGGGIRKLFDNRPNRVTQRQTDYSLSWSADSRWIAFADWTAEPARITAVSLEGEEWTLTDPPANAFDVAPAFSPDGEQLAWARRTSNSMDIFTMRLPSGLPTKLHDSGRNWMTWTPDSRGLIVSGRRPAHLLLVDLSGGAARDLPDTASAIQPAISPDGSRLAFARSGRQNDVLRVDLQPGSLEPASFAPFFSSTLPEFAPAISPDGLRVALNSWRAGDRDLWTVNADGSDALRLVHDGFAPRWSPDGRRIAFDRPFASDNGQGVWVVDAEGGAPTLLTEEGKFSHQPCWSADGRSIYFGQGTVQSGRLFTTSAAGESRPVPFSQGEAARCWVSEGWVYFGSDADILRAPQNHPGEAELVLEGRLFRECGHWQVLNGGLYFIDFEEGRRTGRWVLKRLDLAGDSIEDVVDLPRPPQTQNGLAVAPDESWFLYTVLNAEEQDLYMIEGLDWGTGE